MIQNISFKFINLILKQLCKGNTARIRSYSQKRAVILGIESSCDDTGCAIVDNEGNILGEALHSQHSTHLQHGGIIPPIAQNLHRIHIHQVVSDAVNSAKISFQDIDAVAATIKPGLPRSLSVGLKYGKYLCKKYNKPFIPIHHMQAHALTARMYDHSIQFPFLVLLVSGGHCLLAVAKDLDDFLLLGSTRDDAPGEAFDKVARRLKMRNMPEFCKLNGGQAIELAATRADNPLEYTFNVPLLHYRDCNFSIAGLKNQVLRHIVKQEQVLDLAPDAVIPSFYNLCAGFQLCITKHLCHRVQRAMEYVELTRLIPEDNKVLVVSGGVACNNFIAKSLQIICRELGYQLVRPPPKLCTDNGVMIAWNGVEKWKRNKDILTEFDTIDVENNSPIGLDISEDVTLKEIKPQWVKLNKLVNSELDVQTNIQLKTY